MNGVTDAGGINRFPSLVPGTYTVKLELQGFQTIVREGIVYARLYDLRGRSISSLLTVPGIEQTNY